jgi:hypothetical protein
MKFNKNKIMCAVLMLPFITICIAMATYLFVNFETARFVIITVVAGLMFLFAVVRYHEC